MEVTDKNFAELLPQIEASIDRALFLAIDCEYSGLKVTDENENCFESLEDRYLSVRGSASNFLVVQFGLCSFFYDEVNDEFTHEAYNFYTYPKQLTKKSPNIRFLCESSSLEFLAGCGFDFNKLIYEGIPYLTFGNEILMTEEIEKRSSHKTTEDNSTPISVPENMKKFLQQTSQKIQKFRKSDDQEMSLMHLTPFQRKLVFHNIKPHYANELYFEMVVIDEGEEESEEESKGSSSSESIPDDSMAEVTLEGKDSNENQSEARRTQANRGESKCRVLRILKLDKTGQSIREAEKIQKDYATISQNVGFSKVIRKMSQSGKFIVGHNMLLDVTHTIHQFVDELPDNLADFKDIVQATFPNLVDTKHMASAGPFRELISSHVLFDLAKRIQQKPFKLPKIGVPSHTNSVGYELTDRKKHEAGFDAFITGCCFIALTQFLGSLQHPPKRRVMPSSPLILPFLNKLYLMRMADISYLNISGRDLTPSRSHVFYVTCPKDATQKSILQIFNPFGNVQTWWRNSSSLFVSLNDKDQSSLVMDNIECSSGYRVSTFAAYQKLVKEEKKRPLLGDSPERAGDIFRKLVCGDKSPPREHHLKKRPKTEAEKILVKQVFAEPASWN